jgi:glutamyl/glutaminyl-tRNA synthetase
LHPTRNANVANSISRHGSSDRGFIYPCTCSRKDLAQSASAPNDFDDEPIYPGECRARTDANIFENPAGVNWRFRVPDGEEIAFVDNHLCRESYVAGRDFGDFVIWRRDDVPAYQLAVIADDHAMRITEVVRGADLLKSTARQMLLYRALEFVRPEFYHCDLVRDEVGNRLAKRHDALSIRALRESGLTPSRSMFPCSTILVSFAPCTEPALSEVEGALPGCSL